MNRAFRSSFRVALVFAALAFSSTAFAQATRTWVSGVGDDANPCSRTAPCKTFAGAISKTAAGGEISVLDPGGFGAVTITKAMTIDGGGIGGSILNSFTHGVVINAGVNDVINLRNLTINGAGNGLSGIRFLAGGALHVDNVSMTGFTGRGIDFLPSAGSELFVKNSSIQRAQAGGIAIQPTISGAANATIENVSLVNNSVGVRVEARSNVALSHCSISGNTNNGVLVFSTSALAQAAVSNCVISGNGSDDTAGGVKVEGAGARAFLSGNTISNNTIGILPANGGTVLSYNNNPVAGNGSDGNANLIIATR